jgi:predicted O-methyltransferase YrrM
MKLTQTDLLFPANLRIARDIRRFAPDLADPDGVPGLLERREAETLYVLVRRAAGLGDVVEIGSYRGRSTAFLAQALADEGGSRRLIAIDPHLEGTEEDFRANVSAGSASSLVDARVAFSHDVAQEISGPLGVVWIDGDHSYDGVRQDFEDWFPKLATGGWVAFHDTVDQWYGPTRLAGELLRTRRDLADVGVVGTLMYARKMAPSSVNRLRAVATVPRIELVRAARRRSFGRGARNVAAGDE